MERIYRYRMTTTSGGNLSIREDNGDVWITPARVDKGGLRRSDVVLVRADGTVEGEQPPSSELPLHQAVYRARPDVHGIVHAHPVALVAFSLVHDVPNARLFHQAWQVCGEGGFAPYALPGSAGLGSVVAGTFAEGFDCVILENHGVVTAGGDLQEAFRRFETFEFTGKTIIKARLLGKEIRYLSDEELALAHQHQSPLLEFVRAGPEPSSVEKELRRTVCDFVRRAYRQRLFISTQGSFSARLSGSSFLITPRGVDRGAVEVDELALVEGGRAEVGSAPSRAAGIHAAIYRRHPQIGAIVNAYPVNATAFSVCGVGGRYENDPGEPCGRAPPWDREFRRPVHRSRVACRRGFTAAAGRDPGEQRRAGHRRGCSGRVRPTRGAGVDGRGADQRESRRHDGSSVR